MAGIWVIEDPDEIASYNLYYSALEEQALNPAESLELISKIAGKL
ncbi:Scr1 family TA system antitoxin-like transcriptional regulator [Saccharopolyspora shandongensis]